MRRALGYVGAAAVVGGVLVVAVDGLDSVPGVAVAVVLVALAAVLFGFGALLDRRFSDAERPSPPVVERSYSVPVPGDDLDPTTGDASASVAFRRGLTRRVVAALVERRELSEDAAETAVDDGSWTDDPVAAAYLGDETVRFPLRVRLRSWFGGEDRTELSARRTVDALERLREGDG